MQEIFHDIKQVEKKKRWTVEYSEDDDDKERSNGGGWEVAIEIWKRIQK